MFESLETFIHKFNFMYLINIFNDTSTRFELERDEVRMVDDIGQEVRTKMKERALLGVLSVVEPVK